MSNISPKKRVHRYLQNRIFNFKLKFHLEDGLVQQRYFEFYFSAWSLFSSYKRSLLIEAVFRFFTFVVILHRSHPIFFCGKYGTLGTQKERQKWESHSGPRTLRFFIMEGGQHGTLTFFSSNCFLDGQHKRRKQKKHTNNNKTNKLCQYLITSTWSTFLSLLHFKKRKQKIQAGLPIHYEK